MTNLHQPQAMKHQQEGEEQVLGQVVQTKARSASLKKKAKHGRMDKRQPEESDMLVADEELRRHRLHHRQLALSKRKGPVGRLGARRHSSLPSSPVLRMPLHSPWSSPSPEALKEKTSTTTSSSSSSSSFHFAWASLLMSADSSSRSSSISASSSPIGSEAEVELYDDPCNDSDCDAGILSTSSSTFASIGHRLLPTKTNTAPSLSKSSSTMKMTMYMSAASTTALEDERIDAATQLTARLRKKQKKRMAMMGEVPTPLRMPDGHASDALFGLIDSKVRQLERAVQELNQALSFTALEPYFGNVGHQLQALSQDANLRLSEVSTFYKWLKQHNTPSSAAGMGYFSILPEELNLYILSFLTVTDLTCVQAVSRYWRRLAEDDQLWQRQHHSRWGSKAHPMLLRHMSFEDNGSASDASPEDEDNIKPRRSKRKRRGWKEIYADAHQLDHNWREGLFSTKLIRRGATAQESAYCIKFDESRMITGSNDRCIRLMDIKSGTVLHSIIAHTAEVRSVDFDSLRMVSGSRDRAVKVWDINTGQCLATMEEHAGPVKCMQMSDNLVMSGSEDATTKMLDLNSGKVVNTFKGHLWGVACLQFKDNYLVSGSRDRRIFVWDKRFNRPSIDPTESTRKCLMMLEGHVNTVRCVAFNSDNIVSGSWDNTVKVWSAVTGKLKNTLEGHDGRVLHLDFDKNKIVSGSVDKSVRVWWNYESAEDSVSYSLHMHHAPIFYVTLNDYGITSASRDTELMRWDFHSPCPEDIKKTKRSCPQHSFHKSSAL